MGPTPARLDELEGGDAAESVHVITAFESVPGRAAEALSLARELARQMKASPGALEVQLLQGVHRPDLLEIVSTWESQDAYDGARDAPKLAATLREVDGLLASPVDDRLHHAI